MNVAHRHKKSEGRGNEVAHFAQYDPCPLGLALRAYDPTFINGVVSRWRDIRVPGRNVDGRDDALWRWKAAREREGAHKKRRRLLVQEPPRD
jgi:hypothetical protein